MTYKLADGGAIRLADRAFIPGVGGNRDWREYQKWLAAGNVPLPADPPPPIEADPDAELATAIAAATTLEELKAALLGRLNPNARVKGRRT